MVKVSGQPLSTTIGISDLVRQLLILLGEDVGREGLEETPNRVEEALLFLTRGYRQDIDEVVNGAFYQAPPKCGPVVVKNIDFFSLCEHHLLPFFGRCHIAYIPKDRVIGLSKLPRLVEVFSRRLQLQERLTTQVAEAIQEKLDPNGVAVATQAYHLCMMMRGVEQTNASVLSTVMLGQYESDYRLRKEFLDSLPDGGK